MDTIENWYWRLPEFERELPLIVHDTKEYSPKEILEESKRETSLGKELVKLKTTGFVAPKEMLAPLAKKRLFILFEKRPAKISMITPEGIPGEQTSEDLKKSVETEDILGKSLIETEINYMYKLVRL